MHLHTPLALFAALSFASTALAGPTPNWGGPPPLGEDIAPAGGTNGPPPKPRRDDEAQRSHGRNGAMPGGEQNRSSSVERSDRRRRPPLTQGQPTPSANLGSVGWTQQPGCAREISIGRDGFGLVTGCASGGHGGNEVYRHNGSGWEQVPGAALKVSANYPLMAYWAVNAQGQIFHANYANGQSEGAGAEVPAFTSFEAIPGCAREISVSGELWVLGCASAGPDGYEIYAGNIGAGVEGQPDIWTFGNWRHMPGGAVRIASGSDTYRVTASGAISLWHRETASWTPMPGCAKEISANYDHLVVLGCARDAETGGWEVYRWNGGTFVREPGGAEKIAVDANGSLWALDAQGNIWRR